ncbi:NADH-dependent flavin oxidoreductase [Secundilactobacillus paracollinoides]|uniref:NADH-dependent flavin oxidoreductase n=1 Tax=Secundilactobacillus paracollinoides TaxID=240427 RepID=A0A1B2IX40_9LACO|nr:NADH-dependent flavin oxidoreductase [Secundilactobacillus paracollinoides]ANZ60759.1 NADH-dependent flavin oxidoreductase [Secundilactobacillus paracollinoides]ANZ65131.1 NADH-dependent flavin oxidoreductase [Secundilactobacillus paracollinoides]ANZ66603.1 NADH-dependent flavin oxidoreductase [Secundilactobacillus paracollinoides]
MTDYNFLNPYRFRNGAVVKNRIVMAPMTEMSAHENGAITKDQIDYYGMRSGGVGMELTACAYVTPAGKGFEGNLGVDSDRMIPGLAKLAQAMKLNGTKAILQIFDAGRMTNSKILRGQQPVSASAIAAERPGSETPRALTGAEVLDEIKAFGEATRRAIAAGFDGVEIHGANTYLIQQFYSPNSNQREDKWGGNLENRMRFPLAVIDQVKEVADQYANHDFIVGYRISPEEIETPGIRLEDTLTFVDRLADAPLDYLHVSMGNVWRTSLNDKEATEPILPQILRVLDDRIPLIGVGNIEKPEDAEKVIDAGIDFATIGRELIREPQWVQKIIANDEGTIRYQLSPSDIDDLNIPAPLWDFLNFVFKPIAGISTEATPEETFANATAPWEKF